MAPQKQTRLGTMRTWVQSLALLCGLRIQCCREQVTDVARSQCCCGCGLGQQLQLRLEPQPGNFLMSHLQEGRKEELILNHQTNVNPSYIPGSSVTSGKCLCSSVPPHSPHLQNGDDAAAAAAAAAAADDDKLTT